MSTPWIVAFAVLVAIVAILALTVLGTLRRISVVLEQAESAMRAREGPGPGGLEPGTPIPEFEGVFWDGSPFSPASLVGTPSVIVFLGPNCPACRVLEEDLATKDVTDVGARVIAVVSDPDHAERIVEIEGLEIVLQSERGIAEAFQSKATPHAFAVDAGGVVWAAATPNTVEGLKNLVSSLEGGDREIEVAIVQA